MAYGDGSRRDSGVGWSSALRPEFLAEIIDRVAHPIFVKDRSFRFVVLNRALCEMAGYSRSTMLGKTDYDFFPKEEADFFRLKDVEVFETKKPVVIEEETFTDASGKRRVLATTKVPLMSPAGEVTHLVGIIHEITELKAAQEALRRANEELEKRVRERTRALEEAQLELVRKERLAVLGRLAGGLAHQIRNPLGAISNSVSVLKRLLRPPPEADIVHALDIIDEEVWKANRIITDLLDYARVRPANKRPIEIRRVLDDVLRTQLVPRSVVIDVQTADLPKIAVDVDQVRDAFENLVQNAIEAMPEGGRLEIRGARDGESHVIVRIADTGPGIDPSVREHLFEPLVTTKPAGMGLGLPTARALVENQGGSIHVVPTASGACFVVRLPVAA